MIIRGQFTVKAEAEKAFETPVGALGELKARNLQDIYKMHVGIAICNPCCKKIYEMKRGVD